ncbi:MAG: zinc ribbon domain-containing protein [Acidimicrobiales bacterium]|nr:zinc ribbon domain-containing protein [Acidimicrobiales bacterium]
MTETRDCPNCGAHVPALAAFCTECGEQLSMPTSTDDPTRVAEPGLGDATSVGPSFTAPPTTAPWNPPANPPPPTWQVPVAPPTAATSAPPPAWASSPSTPPPPSYDPDAAPSARARRTPAVLGGVAALIGATVTIAGVLSTWVTLEQGDNVERISGWSMTSDSGLLTSDDPYLLVGLAVLAAVGGIVLFTGAARTLVRIGLALIGVGIVGITALNWFAIADFVTDNLATSFQVRTAVGFYVAIAGGTITALAALLPAKS